MSSDCFKKMRDIWPLSLCRRKHISFVDLETGLPGFGDARVVLSPEILIQPAKLVYDPAALNPADAQPPNSQLGSAAALGSHRSTHTSHQAVSILTRE